MVHFTTHKRGAEGCPFVPKYFYISVNDVSMEVQRHFSGVRNEK